MSANEIGRELGLSRSTVKTWVRGQVPRSAGPHVCPACGGRHDLQTLDATYVYLLGLYLGDGCISAHHRGVFRLRITLDVEYPLIISSARSAVAAVRQGKVDVCQRNESCVDVSSYWRSWPCLAPQHGPGKKQDRPIVLDSWQRSLVERWPDQLLRGLIHSDGCRFENTGRNGWRAPRYVFSQVSDDIRGIFCFGCELMNLSWTSSGNVIYVSRKADVARLDSFIGPKR